MLFICIVIIMRTLILFLIFLCPVPAPAESDWRLSASVNYETGDYGTGIDTDTLYMPLTIKRYLTRGNVSLTVPYIRQTNTGLVTVIDGVGVKIRRKRVLITENTESGLGDIILRGGLYLLDSPRHGLTLTGRIKLPTADEEKGLGTGEFDETVGLEFAALLRPPWTLYLDTYYTFIGEPPGADFKNRFSFDMGLGRQLTESVSGSLYYEESTSIVEGTENLRDIMASIEVRLNKFKASRDVRLFVGAYVGLTQSSPDYGLSVGLSVKV